MNKKRRIPMQKVLISTGALVLGLAMASATALAQNMQGPAAPNFGLTSNPQSGSTAPSAISPQPLYNYATGEGTQARHRTKHGTGGYRR
jgi:hypothetical protein